MKLSTLLKEIKDCKVCAEHLPMGCNPVLTAGTKSKIIVIGHAPRHIVYKTHIAWNDKSGNRLRMWMGVDKETIYDIDQVALVPMGFCYPGTRNSGDLPPRKECAPLWHTQLLPLLSNVKLIILTGAYAQKYYLGKNKKNLTRNVQHYAEYLPLYFPLPHPSGRSNIWLKNNPWFEEETVPHLKHLVNYIIQ